MPLARRIPIAGLYDFYDDYVPDELRRLREQEARIKADQLRAMRDEQNMREAELIRERIRKAGHKPVCCIRPA